MCDATELGHHEQSEQVTDQGKQLPGHDRQPDTHNRNSEDNSALAMSGMEPREKTLQVNLHLNTDMMRMQKEGQTFNVL